MVNVDIIRTDTERSGWQFTVRVQGDRVTEHDVTVREEYWQTFSGVYESVEALVLASFAFLLEREPNTSILRSFDLSLISTYFPEYEEELLQK